jgi:hypothetical protein
MTDDAGLEAALGVVEDGVGRDLAPGAGGGGDEDLGQTGGGDELDAEVALQGAGVGRA